MVLWPEKHQWKSWSLPSKLTAIGTLVGIISLGLYMLEKSFNLKELILRKWSEKQSASVPEITLRVSNSSDQDISFYSEGEFVLWLPQGVNFSVRTIPGKYKLILLNNTDKTNGIITVHPGEEVIMAAELMNQAYFSKLLHQGDTDLCLIFRRSNGSIFFSPNIPFRHEDIKKYYLQVDAGKRE